MVESVSRARFLSGDFSGKRTPRRPPWAKDEADFVESCQRSGACIAACPEKILEKGRGGFPQVNFALGACTFCKACLEACTRAAFHKDAQGKPEGVAWGVKVRIGESCLTLSQVVCRTCGEHCPEGAIRFPPVLGGVAKPVIDEAGCTGCGACFAPCPNASIELVG